MSAVDDVIKTVGIACTLIRTGGNVSTFFYANPKDNWSSGVPYERSVMMPTDSSIVSGDIVSQGSDYYLAVNTLEDRRAGEFFYYRVRMYKCNSLVTIRSQNPTTKLFVDSSTNVQCLITQLSSETSEDKSIVVPQYSGRDKLFNCFMPSSKNLNKNQILVDASGRQFRVTENMDPLYAVGVVRAMVKWENV